MILLLHTYMMYIHNIIHTMMVEPPHPACPHDMIYHYAGEPLLYDTVLYTVVEEEQKKRSPPISTKKRNNTRESSRV